jgi:hypothetical protein
VVPSSVLRTDRLPMLCGLGRVTKEGVGLVLEYRSSFIEKF